MRLQCADHWRGGNAFPDRYRVNPDAARFHRWQAEGEAFIDTPSVSRRLARAQGQTQGNQGQGQVQQQGIEKSVHGGAA